MVLAVDAYDRPSLFAWTAEVRTGTRIEPLANHMYHLEYINKKIFIRVQYNRILHQNHPLHKHSPIPS